MTRLAPCAARSALRGRPDVRRRWRRRGRRGQVAAVATILGLLLLVTMIANYLSTQLPATMKLNDANHALTVENQLARLAGTLRAAAGEDVVGGEFSQPITLGSLGAPPIAAPDGSSIAAGDSGTQFSTSYTVQNGSHKITQTTTTLIGATFVVHLNNVYGPPADVAFDQGSVVYAQANGLPLMLDPPGVNYTGSNLTLWIPQFLGLVGNEVGVGTAELSVRLVSVLALTLPLHGYSLATGSSVVVSVTTPYAAAWLDYLSGVPALSGDVACTPTGSAACVGPFAFGGSLGTVTLTVPATALDIEVATYSVSLT
ncbi:MAG TPA: hypothetical protein VMH49_05305 [Thermoplasmata archaeon]|nr:hypothetical protein [Thermoplasmata archaeon]